MPVLTGLLGVDVTDLLKMGAQPAAILERRILEVERRLLALEARVSDTRPKDGDAQQGSTRE